MSALTVLIDTDVLIDFLTARGAFTKNAKAIIQKSQEQTVRVFLAAHSITNIFYILRKIYSVSVGKIESTLMPSLPQTKT
jgi:predicted nucleic-acid-binding protein